MQDSPLPGILAARRLKKGWLSSRRGAGLDPSYAVRLYRGERSNPSREMLAVIVEAIERTTPDMKLSRDELASLVYWK